MRFKDEPTRRPLPDPEFSQPPWPNPAPCTEACDSRRNGPQGGLGDRGRRLRRTPLRGRKRPCTEVPPRGGARHLHGVVQPGPFPGSPVRLPPSFPRPFGERGGGPENPDRGASSLVQMLVLRLIESGNLARALDSARLQMSIRMEAMAGALSRELPGYPFSRPEGGIYLWLGTPGLDGEEAASLSAARGVEIVPGSEFSVLGEKLEAVRLSISRHGAQSLAAGACVLAAAWGGR